MWEDADGQEGMGGTVYQTFERLQSYAGHWQAELTPDGVTDEYGAALLADIIGSEGLVHGFLEFDFLPKSIQSLTRHIAAADKDSCVVLVGYSLGAWVIGQFLAARIGSGLLQKDRIAAVLLYGDPRFDSSATAFANGPPGASGIVWQHKLTVKPYLPDALAGRARSYCLEDDPICDFESASDLMISRCVGEAGVGAGFSCPHLFYEAGWTPGRTSDGAIFLAEVLWNAQFKES